MSQTSMSVQIVGDGEVVRRLRGMRSRYPKAMRRAMQTAVDAVGDRAIRRLRGQSLNVDRGRLWQSFQTGRWVSDDGRRGKVGSNVEYARIHEFGGTIRHPGGTAYVRDDRSRGRWGLPLVFIDNETAAGFNFPRTRAHSIVIPARPYLRPALRESKKTIIKAFKDETRRLMRELA